MNRLFLGSTLTSSRAEPSPENNNYSPDYSVGCLLVLCSNFFGSFSPFKGQQKCKSDQINLECFQSEMFPKLNVILTQYYLSIENN